MSALSRILARMLPEFTEASVEGELRKVVEAGLRTASREERWGSVYAPLLKHPSIKDDPARQQIAARLINVLDEALQREQEATRPPADLPGGTGPIAGEPEIISRRRARPQVSMVATPESVFARTERDMLNRGSGHPITALPTKLQQYLEGEATIQADMRQGIRRSPFETDPHPLSSREQPGDVHISTLSNQLSGLGTQAEPAREGTALAAAQKIEKFVHEEMQKGKVANLSVESRALFKNLFESLSTILDPETPIEMPRSTRSAFEAKHGLDTGAGNNNLLRLLYEVGIFPAQIRQRGAFVEESFTTTGLASDKLYRARIVANALDSLGDIGGEPRVDTKLQRAFKEFLMRRTKVKNQILFEKAPVPSGEQSLVPPLIGSVASALRVLRNKFPKMKLKDIYDPTDQQAPYVKALIPSGVKLPTASVWVSERGLVESPIYPLKNATIGTDFTPKFPQGTVVHLNRNASTVRISNLADKNYLVVDEVAFSSPFAKKDFQHAVALAQLDDRGIPIFERPIYVAVPSKGASPFIVGTRPGSLIPEGVNTAEQARKLAYQYRASATPRPQDLAKPGTAMYEIFDETGQLVDFTPRREMAIKAIADGQMVHQLPIGELAPFEKSTEIDTSLVGRMLQGIKDLSAKHIDDIVTPIHRIRSLDLATYNEEATRLGRALIADINEIKRRIPHRGQWAGVARMFAHGKAGGKLVDILPDVEQDLIESLEDRVSPLGLIGRLQAQLALDPDKVPDIIRAVAESRAKVDVGRGFLGGEEAATARIVHDADLRAIARTMMRQNEDRILNTMSFGAARARLAGVDPVRDAAETIKKRMTELRAEAREDPTAFVSDLITFHTRRLEKEGYEYILPQIVDAGESLPEIHLTARSSKTGESVRFRVSLGRGFAGDQGMLGPDLAAARQAMEEATEQLTSNPISGGQCDLREIEPEG